MTTLQDIERAINELQPQQLAELYAWLDAHRPAGLSSASDKAPAQGLGLFGSPEDAALLDAAVGLAYEERKRPSGSKSSL